MRTLCRSSCGVFSRGRRPGRRQTTTALDGMNQPALCQRPSDASNENQSEHAADEPLIPVGPGWHSCVHFDSPCCRAMKRQVAPQVCDARHRAGNQNSAQSTLNKPQSDTARSAVTHHRDTSMTSSDRYRFAQPILRSAGSLSGLACASLRALTDFRRKRLRRFRPTRSGMAGRDDCQHRGGEERERLEEILERAVHAAVTPVRGAGSSGFLPQAMRLEPDLRTMGIASLNPSYGL